MDAFRVINVIVPEHGIIRDISSWMPFVTPVHRRELYGLADEEYWQVVKYEILDALFSIQLR